MFITFYVMKQYNCFIYCNAFIQCTENVLNSDHKTKLTFN